MKRTLILLLIFLGVITLKAQVAVGPGQISASFETNTVVYVSDNAIAETPEDKFGTNNYLKLDYTLGKFSAGVQAEAYLPALYGYEIRDLDDPKKFFLASKYVQWQDDCFSVYVGDIYDQFGNGLIFRSYEDRQLGLNNSLEGIRATYNFKKYFAVKAMYGRPRLYTDYADSWVRGVDLSVSLADIFDWNAILFQLEGSYVNRYEALDKSNYVDWSEQGLTSPNLDMFSGRANFAWKGLSLRGEYVHKSNDLVTSNSNASEGQAGYAEVIYNYKALSLSATYRMLDHMGTMLSIYESGTANMLNYLPALSRQYTYMLANLNPYQVNTVGEDAVQIDLFYSLRSKTSRYRYWNFHANFSTAYTRDASQTLSGDTEKMWSDVNFDVERQWNKSLKTIFLFSRQEWSSDYGYSDDLIGSNIFVLDVTYKFSKKYSLRGELQYLLADDYDGASTHYEGDWIAGLIEFNVAPKWSVFYNDMYNLGETDTNYYSGGFSYTKNRTRVQLSYGRNRAGYVCSGGVCRYTPAFTGLNIALTTSF